MPDSQSGSLARHLARAPHKVGEPCAECNAELRNAMFRTYAPATELPEEARTDVRGEPVDGDVLP
jgi:hypothetical protein